MDKDEAALFSGTWGNVDRETEMLHVAFSVLFLHGLSSCSANPLQLVPSAVSQNTAAENASIQSQLLASASTWTGQVKAARTVLSSIQADVTNAPCTQASIEEQRAYLWAQAVFQLDLLQYAPDKISQAIGVRDVLVNMTCNLLVPNATIGVLHTIDNARRSDLLKRMKSAWSQFNIVIAAMEKALKYKSRASQVVSRCSLLQSLVNTDKAALKCWETANFTKIQILLQLAPSLSTQINQIWNAVVSLQTDTWQDSTVQGMYVQERDSLSICEQRLRDLQIQYQKWLTCLSVRDRLRGVRINLQKIYGAVNASGKLDTARKSDLSSRLTSAMASIDGVVASLVKQIGSI